MGFGSSRLDRPPVLSTPLRRPRPARSAVRRPEAAGGRPGNRRDIPHPRAVTARWIKLSRWPARGFPGARYAVLTRSAARSACHRRPVDVARVPPCLGSTPRAVDVRRLGAIRRRRKASVPRTSHQPLNVLPDRKEEQSASIGTGPPIPGGPQGRALGGVRHRLA
jgi:hypothetical protein